jgi:hypothetical protein
LFQWLSCDEVDVDISCSPLRGVVVGSSILQRESSVFYLHFMELILGKYSFLTEIIAKLEVSLEHAALKYIGFQWNQKDRLNVFILG